MSHSPAVLSRVEPTYLQLYTSIYKRGVKVSLCKIDCQQSKHQRVLRGACRRISGRSRTSAHRRREKASCLGLDTHDVTERAARSYSQICRNAGGVLMNSILAGRYS